MAPPCSSAILRQMDKPSPALPRSREEGPPDKRGRRYARAVLRSSPDRRWTRQTAGNPRPPSASRRSSSRLPIFYRVVQQIDHQLPQPVRLTGQPYMILHLQGKPAAVTLGLGLHAFRRTAYQGGKNRTVRAPPASARSDISSRLTTSPWRRRLSSSIWRVPFGAAPDPGPRFFRSAPRIPKSWSRAFSARGWRY